MNFDMKINKYVDIYVNVIGRMEDWKYLICFVENIFCMLMWFKFNLLVYWFDGCLGFDIEFGDNLVVICIN